MKRYPGIRPFTAEDAHLFKGRDEEKRDLFQLIVLNDIVVLFGKSGIGKSSLLNAGVCPQLEDRNLHPVFIRLNNTTLPPEKQVLELLQEKKYIDSDLPDNLTLWEYLKQFWYVDLGEVFTPVIVLDQFEELFTLYTPQQRQNFINQFSDIVNGHVPNSVRQKVKSSTSDLDKNIDWETPPKVKFILSIRSDYLYLLDELSADIPAILRTRFQLQMLKKNNAIEAITLPAALTGNYESPQFNYSENAITEVVEELGKKEKDQLRSDLPDSEPEIEAFQLQLFCQHLENKIINQKKPQDFTITPDFYGEKEGIKIILKEFYSGVISRIPPALQDTVETLMAKNLIRNKRRIIMEESAIIADAKIPKNILDQLHEERVLRKEARTGNFYYEISHDTLVEPVLEKYNIIAQRLEREKAIAREKELEAANKKVEIEKQKAAEQAKLRAAAEQNEKRARQRTRLASFVSLLALLLAGTAFVFWKNANEANDKTAQALIRATSKEKEATLAKEDAEVKRIEADSSAVQAKREKIKAEQNKREADFAKNMAFSAKAKADKATQSAKNVSLAFDIARNNSTLALQIAQYNYEKHPEDPTAGTAISKIFNDTKGTYVDIVQNKDSEKFTAVALSSDNKKILTGSLDGKVALWDMNGKKLLDLNTSEKDVQFVGFSPDDNIIAAIASYSYVYLWNLEGKLINSYSTYWAFSLAFSPDSKSIAFSDKGKAVYVNLEDNKSQSFDMPEVYVLGMSTDGKTIIGGSSDGYGKIKIVDLENEPTKEIESKEHSISAIAFSSDNKYFLAGDGSGFGRVHLYEDYKFKEQIYFGNSPQIKEVSFSPDDTKILIVEIDGYAELIEKSGKELFSMEFANSAAFSKNGKNIISVNDDFIQRWSINNKAEIESNFGAVVFSPDNKYYFKRNKKDNSLKLKNIMGNELPFPQKKTPSIKLVTFSPDSKKILTRNKDNQLKIWDLQGNELQRFRGHTSEISIVTFSPDGKYISTGDKDGVVKVWDLKGNEIQTLKGDSSNIKILIFSPDGKNILTGNEEGKIKMWNLKGIELLNIKKPIYHLENLKFSFDGNVIIANNRFGSLPYTWDLAGKKLDFSKITTKENKLLIISQEGFYTKNKSGEIKLWNYKGNLLKDFKKLKHYQDEEIISFSPDGRTYLTKTREDLIRWRDFKGNILQIIKITQTLGEIGKSVFSVLNVSFSPDGKIIIIKDSDGKTHLYETYLSYLESKVKKFSLQELYDAGVQLTAEDLKKVKR
ncbi:MAG: hypothetical protein AB8H03_23635 [Saprospiraceae bacterium]